MVVGEEFGFDFDFEVRREKMFLLVIHFYIFPERSHDLHFLWLPLYSDLEVWESASQGGQVQGTQ